MEKVTITVPGHQSDHTPGFVDALRDLATFHGYEVVYSEDSRLKEFMRTHSTPVLFVSMEEREPVIDVLGRLVEELGKNPSPPLLMYEAMGGQFVPDTSVRVTLPHMQRSGFLGRGQKGKPRTLAKGRG